MSTWSEVYEKANEKNTCQRLNMWENERWEETSDYNDGLKPLNEEKEGRRIGWAQLQTAALL
jgi:hypothetical protein